MCGEHTCSSQLEVMPERDPTSRDKVNVRVLLINGKSHDFPFDPSTTGSQIALHVFHNWPSEWDDGAVQKPPRAEILRLIYRGRFLHESTKLSALSLPLGKTTVMHMIIKERLPDEQSTDRRRSRNKSRSDTGDSNCCVIL